MLFLEDRFYTPPPPPRGGGVQKLLSQFCHSRSLENNLREVVVYRISLPIFLPGHTLSLLTIMNIIHIYIYIYTHIYTIVHYIHIYIYIYYGMFIQYYMIVYTLSRLSRLCVQQLLRRVYDRRHPPEPCPLRTIVLLLLLLLLLSSLLSLK